MLNLSALVRPAILGDLDLPGNNLNLDSPRPGAWHVSSAFIALAFGALLLVGFLVWDFCRQKRVEKRERERLHRFRERKLAESASGSGMVKQRRALQD